MNFVFPQIAAFHGESGGSVGEPDRQEGQPLGREEQVHRSLNAFQAAISNQRISLRPAQLRLVISNFQLSIFSTTNSFLNPLNHFMDVLTCNM